jgi:hypothetical protein
MLARTLIVLLPLTTFLGCSDRAAHDVFDGSTSPPRTEGHLAYEHLIVVEVDEDAIPEQFKKVVEACTKDRKHNCTILQSELSSGEEVSGSIRLRVMPDGIDSLISVAASGGEVTRRRTHVEDLAKVIADGEKRIEMLTTYRDRLIGLEQQAENDIDALIKITSELTKVQSDLEHALGEHAYQKQRVELEILSVRFVAEESRSTLGPVRQSIRDFGENLSEGIAQAITGVAYVLPWLIVVLLVFPILRLFWRKIR